MRKLCLIFLVTVVAVLLLAVGLETAGNALYYFKRGKIFYVDVHATLQAQNGANTVAQAVFHPYYSYIHRVGRSGTYPVGGVDIAWTTNNVGFQVVTKLVQDDPHCCDYPMPKREGEILVGIFGGSVASSFALTAQASPEFIEKLAQIPGWAGKRIRIFNFAMPGFKQPQQLITLAYYMSLGQHFDLVLNLDGFNEVVSSHRNWAAGVEPSYPADTLWGDWSHTLEKRALAFDEGNGESYQAAYYRVSARGWQRRGDGCSIASCYAICSTLAEFDRWRAHRLEASARKLEEQTTLFPTAITSRSSEKFDIFDYTADQWAASSREMAALVRPTGAMYLHVIQPNQWWKATGDYQPIERDHIYKWVIDLINIGYPRLLSRVPALATSGIPVFDATMLFREFSAREMYVDDCCHYTDKGAKLFGAKIADQVSNLVAQRTGTP